MNMKYETGLISNLLDWVWFYIKYGKPVYLFVLVWDAWSHFLLNVYLHTATIVFLKFQLLFFYFILFCFVFQSKEIPAHDAI